MKIQEEYFRRINNKMKYDKLLPVQTKRKCFSCVCEWFYSSRTILPQAGESSEFTTKPFKLHQPQIASQSSRRAQKAA